MSNTIRVLVVLLSEKPGPGLQSLMAREELSVSTCASCREGLLHLQEINPHDVIVECCDDSSSDEPDGFGRLLEASHVRGATCLVLVSESFIGTQQIPEWVQTVNIEVSGDELWGRLASIRHHQVMIRQAQLEIRHLRRLGRHLNKQFTELDQDMRLASRLQREFLPHALPEVPSALVIKF